MTSGGARTKSGPPADPSSARSDQRGFKMTALPAAGFQGSVPDLAAYMDQPTARHQVIWSQLWRTPQACMWDRQPWLIPIVADLVRCQVRSEDPKAPAAWETPILRIRAELGLTHSGMRFLGWAVSEDELAQKRAEKAEPAPKQQRRLRSADAQQ